MKIYCIDYAILKPIAELFDLHDGVWLGLMLGIGSFRVRYRREVSVFQITPVHRVYDHDTTK